VDTTQRVSEVVALLDMRQEQAKQSSLDGKYSLRSLADSSVIVTVSVR